MTVAEIIENNKVDKWVKEMENEAFGEYGPELNDAWDELDEYED